MVQNLMESAHYFIKLIPAGNLYEMFAIKGVQTKIDTGYAYFFQFGNMLFGQYAIRGYVYFFNTGNCACCPCEIQ